MKKSEKLLNALWTDAVADAYKNAHSLIDEITFVPPGETIIYPKVKVRKLTKAEQRAILAQRFKDALAVLRGEAEICEGHDDY